MRRIIAAITLALAISALTAGSALACVPAGVAVYAPNPNYRADNNPPPRHFITCIPDNQGTQQAADSSPAIQPGCLE